METITLELEVDPFQPGVSGADLIDTGSPELAANGIEVQIKEYEEGHGFGVSEVITIVISIGGAVTSDLIASSLKHAAKGVIRRVRGRRHRGDGSVEGISGVVEDERNQASDPKEN